MLIGVNDPTAPCPPQCLVMTARRPMPHRRFFQAVILFALLGTHWALSARADRVKVLYLDAEASQARVDLIRQAKSELYVSYFVVRDDAASLSGFVLLLDAADRGVQ